MSFEDGWSALHLEKPARVPRTEYSAHQHWELVNRVTGSNVGPHSEADKKAAASAAFMQAWNYDLFWSIRIHGGELDACNTDMGHATYAAGGVDRRDTVHCPFTNTDQVLAFQPAEVYGPRNHGELVRAYNEHWHGLERQFPGMVHMTGVYITLISGLITIFGWDRMLEALAEPQAFGAVTDSYAAWMQVFFDALADSDAPVVMVHDDIVWTSGAFCHPDWYRRYVFPNYKKLFAPLVEAGKIILYTSDGNFSAFIDDVANCGVSGFVLEPTTDMAAIAERYGNTHVFVGNADTRILLNGTPADIRVEVQRCMDIGKRCPGFFMAVGNHIPANTPVANSLAYNEIYEELSRR